MPRVNRLDAFVDRRGEIRDLVVEPLDSVTLIQTVAGAVRGNHYHLDTSQWTYVVSGRMRVVSEMLPDGPQEDVFEAGDLLLTPPKERHAWQALEDTTVLVFTRGPRSGANYESDTFRLDDDSRLIP